MAWGTERPLWVDGEPAQPDSTNTVWVDGEPFNPWDSTFSPPPAGGDIPFNVAQTTLLVVMS